ncbi:hypothetical protein F2Q68_00021782 [Brassica cretica]|uniref:Uncharacterized protein n=1 Tax=Brassica cretica TaxID=69181 RepID=A0A8S9G6D5_BRACR|nr:hypothetical protein F2Q68_00021782 [Brassica cretica]
MLCAASEPFIFLLWSYEPGRIGVKTRDQLDPRNVEAGFEVETWSQGEPNVIEGRFQAGTGSMQGPETVKVVDEPGALALRILPYGYGPVYVVGVLVAAGEIDR